jgi:aryl carrier-like protein
MPPTQLLLVHQVASKQELPLVRLLSHRPTLQNWVALLQQLEPQVV